MSLIVIFPENLKCDVSVTDRSDSLKLSVTNILLCKYLFIINYENTRKRHFVGKKAKRRISKRVLQKKRSTSNFTKNEHFLPSDTHTNVYILRGIGIRNVSSSEKFVYALNK